MAPTPTLAAATRTALGTSLNTLINTGSTIDIYSGTRPTNPDTAPSGGATVLATIALGTPPFNASAGVLTINDPAAVTATATGTAAWFRLLNGSDAAILDGSVSATGGGGDLQLATTAITTGLSVDITAGGTITIPTGSAT
jgi:hypothetical protein